MNRQENSENVAAVFHCAPQVTWSVEHDSILIINAELGATSAVNYPGAAIWDMLMLGYSRQSITRVIALLESVSVKEADITMDKYITDWQKMGFLTKE